MRAVKFHLNEPTVINGLSLSPTGGVVLHGPGGPLEPQILESGTFRKSNKGQKVLSLAPLRDEFTINEWAPLAAYDAVFCIDTNTRRVADDLVSVAVILQLRALESNRLATRVSVDPIGAFEFHGLAEKQENAAWWLLSQAVLHGADHVMGRRYAIITDSDLGNHPAYNARERAFWADLMLAPGFTLLYASDAGGGLMNRAIKRCDREANALLQAMDRGAVPLDTATPTPADWAFRRYRYWPAPMKLGVVRLGYLNFPKAQVGSS